MGQFGAGDPLGAFSITPMPSKMALESNYLSFTDAGANSNNFAQLPLLMLQQQVDQLLLLQELH